MYDPRLSDNEQSRANPLVEIGMKIASIAVFFALINGMLWACQEITSGESKSKLNAKKSELESVKRDLDNCNSKLDVYKGLAVNNALPHETYLAYKSDLDTCNSLVEKHNNIVPVVNELGRTAGRRIYLIPIPIPRRAAKALN